MDWIYLIGAGIFEIGWPLGLKWSQVGSARWPGVVLAVACMAMSGLLLWIAQKTIPIGTAYAVWTGIGAVGTFAIGIVFFGDPASLFRVFSGLLIILGVVGLKVFH